MERCSWVRERLEAHAVGALDPEEERRVERHLEQCAECRALADELAADALTLSHALAASSPLRPSESLERRVLEALPHARNRGAHGPARRGFWPRAALGFAALVVVAFFAAWNAHLSSALSKERSLRERLAGLVGNQEIVLDVVDSSKSRRAVLLPPATRRSTAYGKLFTRPDLRDVVAMAARLPRPPSGSAYHLWLTAGRRTMRAGTLAVNEQGFALLVFKSARPGPAYDGARVVLEAEDARRPAGTTALVWRAGEASG